MNHDVFISYNSKDIHIAEAVCHYIEERRVRCFIAPRDITPPDWAASITSAIENAKAFVIIVSEHSITSNEVAKEIALATNVSDYIFPFRIDNSELDGRMTYHLAPFHWIDAVTPPMEQRLNELADRVAAALFGHTANQELGNLSGSYNKSRQQLLGQSIHPRSEFIGRNSELVEIHNLLSDCNAVFLTGMGGIGKSEIAKAYAKMHKDTYTTAVFASYETDLLHLIANDRAIPVENLQQGFATGGQGETIEAYFDRKMKVLRSILNENTLIIIDNFDVEADDKLEEVLELPCKIIFTTRTDFSAYGYETVKIGPMANPEDLVTLMQRIDKTYSDEKNKDAAYEIIKLLDYHTYAVSLTAAQIKASHITPEKMLSQLQSEGLHIQTRSGFARKAGDKKATAYQYIQALFDFSKLDDDACQILRYMACMPREGADIDLFMECCKINDFGDISRLAELHWIQLDEENDTISLHMLVKELVWEQLTPTEDNCEVMLQGAYRWAYNAWNKEHDENCRHSSIIFALLECFPKPAVHWRDAFEDMATFAWIQGHFDLAERCEHYLYQLCADHYGALSEQAGEQALRVAAVYYNQGDYERARPWYEKGLQVQEELDPNSLAAWSARTKVARSDGQRGHYDISLAAFEKNLALIQYHFDHDDLSDEALRKMHIRLAATKQYIAQILACMGRFDEALPYAQQARDYLITDTVEPSLVIYINGVLAYIYQGMGDYAQAMAYTDAAREEMIRYHGPDRIDVLLYLENTGDLLALSGNFSEAKGKYAEVLGAREKLYPADTAAITRLEEKLICAQNGKTADLPFLIMWP